MYAMRQQQEHNLIERIADGDTEAFAVLVDRYAHTVHALVARIVVTAEDAEEVTQDVFLKVFDHLPRFDHRSSPATWIYRIAFNTAVSHARRRRRPTCPIDERRIAAITDDEAERLEEMVERQQALDKLAAAIEALEADERALVTLRYYDDRSVAECAAITGLTEANVKVRLHRIRKKLYAMITSATNEYK